MNKKTLDTESIKSISLRPATVSDCKLLWEWRNDPETRRNSFNTGYIPFNEHEKWFTSALKDQNKRLMMIEEEEIIGVVRFDLSPTEKSAEVNINLNPLKRGKGIGSKALVTSCEYAFDNLGLETLIANIKDSNVASIKAFSKIGFSVLEINKDYIVMIKTNSITYGIKLYSINTNLFEAVNALSKKGSVGYLELYTVPGSFKNVREDLKKLELPVVIHAPHSTYGFNIADPALKKDNLAKLSETFKFADELDAKYVILHAGFGGNIKNAVSFLKDVEDERIIIENMPKIALTGETCIGYTAEGILELLNVGDYGICLDFGHACKAATSLKQDPNQLIEDFLTLKPKLFHLSDGSLHNEKDEHMALGEGDFDLKYFKRCIGKNLSKKVTLETPRINQNSFEESIKNLKYFKSIKLRRK